MKTGLYLWSFEPKNPKLALSLPNSFGMYWAAGGMVVNSNLENASQEKYLADNIPLINIVRKKKVL